MSWVDREEPGIGLAMERFNEDMGFIIQDVGVAVDGFWSEKGGGDPPVLPPVRHRRGVAQISDTILIAIHFTTYQRSSYWDAVIARPRRIVWFLRK